MGLVGQTQQTSFANPQNGQSPIDGDVVRTNDNAVAAKHNAHDADATIHVQTGLLAARPAAGVANSIYLDENGRLYRDNGATWSELPYARLDAAGVNAFDNDVEVGGDLDVLGIITAGGFVGPTLVAASNVTAGTFAAGNFAFPGTLNVASTLTAAAANVASVSASGVVQGASLTATTGMINGARTTNSTSSNVTVAFSANTVRYTVTGNVVFTMPASGTTGTSYVVEILQDATGGRTVSFATSNLEWSGTAPVMNTTANRKDIFVFLWDGAKWLGAQFGPGSYASTG